MGKRGGPRPNSGRPKGRNNRCITLTLPIPAYEELALRAEKAGETVSRYIIKALELPVENVKEESPFCKNYFGMPEDGLLAAEEVKPYGKD